ncbi:Chromatin SPT2 [Trinorchestia longiramus]|nr:Chromatin SPT2 [Trinorchestia longiramus]
MFDLNVMEWNGDHEKLEVLQNRELSSLGKGKPSSEPKGQSSKKEVRSLPSKDAVEAVLKRKKKAEQEKADAFKKDREKLLELRSHDRKAYKRVKAMITRTKGFSKSVVDDAKDLTTGRGEQQCDEDDYGYESTMSQQIFDKLTTQYSEMPEDERLKFKKVKVDNINDVKSRVLNSLKKQEEEEQGPRKRKRKHGGGEQDGFINDGDPYDKASGSSSKESSDKREKSKHEHKLPVNLNLTNYQTKDNENFKYDYDKKKREEKERKEKEYEKEERRKKRMKLASQPPTLGFAELMKLAANKTKETDVKKGEDLAKEQIKERETLLKKKLNDRPLTAQEKAQQEEERLRKLRRQGKLPNLPVEKLKELKEQQLNKKEGKPVATKEESKNHKESNGTDAAAPQKKEQGLDKNSKKVEPKPETKIRDRSKYFAVPGPPKPSVPSSSSSSSFSSKSSSVPNTKLPNGKTPKSVDSKAFKSPDIKSKSLDSSSKYKSPDSKARLEKGTSSGSKIPDRSKAFGSSRPPVPSKGRQFPPADLKPLKKPSGGRFGRVDSEDEDSEYDSEMDDFIDDGEDELDYSSEIKKMFGYDKSRFKDEPEDVDDMEVGFGQVEQEEMRSAKLGLLEDLEDMKQEEEEKKRKLMKKKLTTKGRR